MIHMHRPELEAEMVLWVVGACLYLIGTLIAARSLRGKWLG